MELLSCSFEMGQKRFKQHSLITCEIWKEKPKNALTDSSQCLRLGLERKEHLGRQGTRLGEVVLHKAEL